MPLSDHDVYSMKTTPSMASSDQPSTTTIKTRTCNSPWHYASSLGPFHLKQPPSDSTKPIRLLCRVTSLSEATVIKFIPPYVDFHAHNYSRPTKVHIHTCVQSGVLPPLECGTLANGPELVVGSLLQHQQQYPDWLSSSSSILGFGGALIVAISSFLLWWTSTTNSTTTIK